MRSIIIGLLVGLPLTASAECFMRSATVKDLPTPVTRIADIKRYVVPVDREHFKCNVAFRAEVNHVWHNGEGQSIGTNGDSIDQVCAQAIDSGRSYLLSSVTKGQITSEQEMVCRDDPLPQVKTVRVGDIVRISELAPHPQKPNFFEYRGAKCRWFVESDVNLQTRDIFQWQGVVCNVRKGEWQVVDKF